MTPDIANRASFDIIRYAQVWEDADLLVEALNIQPTDTVLSIASGGDNAFALLAQNPSHVYALDLSAAQIACCQLRVAMYQHLSHQEHLAFGGVVPFEMNRLQVYDQLKHELPPEARAYWDANLTTIQVGFMTQGKFENYFRLFRERALPWVHSKRRVNDLFQVRDAHARRQFYDNTWDSWRWRAMFHLFFSRRVMGKLGRDKAFFNYVQGSVADKLLLRTRHALAELDPYENPYLAFILQGQYSRAFPFSLRAENYEAIRTNLSKITFQQASIEAFIQAYDGHIDAYNLSDIFEYMSQSETDTLYNALANKAALGARFAYWNMLAPRTLSDDLRRTHRITTDAAKNQAYLDQDKAFFYSKFYLDTKEA